MRPGGSGVVAVETINRAGRHTLGLAGELRDRVADVLDAAAEVVPSHPLPRVDAVLPLSEARAALAAAWELVFDEVNRAVCAVGDAAGSARLLQVLGQIKQTEDALVLARLQARDAAFGRVRDALGGLRDCDSTATLVVRATEAVCEVGFDRSIVSRVDEAEWILEHVWVDRDPKWAGEILEVGRANPQVLDRTLVETEMLRRKVGILVRDVQDRPAVHRPVADASQSRAYVAVPLMSGGTVIGFVHGDCYYQGRELDPFDRQLLTVFAEGLGQALGRTSMLDRLAAIRAGVDQVSSALVAAKGERERLGEAPPTVGPDGFVPAGAPAGCDGRFPSVSEGSMLTRRELEVLRLMAAGDTNGRIGRRLVISEGTVKSHVKHILRKLGAANRAEAVSRWLGMEHERGSGRRLGPSARG
jgi:DNA-binding CsgD family transcriptional regulator/GAF domain-containing protein